jgi:hypothetical protein
MQRPSEPIRAQERYPITAHRPPVAIPTNRLRAMRSVAGLGRRIRPAVRAA